MDLVPGRIQDVQARVGQGALKFLGAGARHHPVLPPVDDQHRLADVGQPRAEIVLLDRLVLSNDGVERHLAEMGRVFLHPGGMVGDEARIVEIRVAA